MAADVFQLLIDIFKISQNLVNEYAAQGPLYQIFYLLFFPTIFILIFIWILTNRIMGEHKGLRILLSVGVYAFIILQGYYSWFVMLSKFWFFALIGLGFLYFISYRGGGGRGRGAQGMTSDGGKGGGILNFLQQSTGKTFNPAEHAKFMSMCKRDMLILRKRLEQLQKLALQVKGRGDLKAAEQVFSQIAEVEQALAALQQFYNTGAMYDYKMWKQSAGQLFHITKTE